MGVAKPTAIIDNTGAVVLEYFLTCAHSNCNWLLSDGFSELKKVVRFHLKK